MKKLFLSLTLLSAPALAVVGSSVQPIVTPGQILFGSNVKTITSTGTLTYSSNTDTVGLTNIIINGTCTGSGCGSGGGVGASSLAVNQNGVQISSPTAALNALSPPFKISKVGGTTAQWTLDSSSVTEQGNAFSISGIAASTGTLTISVNNLGASTGTIQTQVNSVAVSTGVLSVSTASLQTQINGLGTTYLTNSSATATYLQTSSATATYLQIPAAASTYLAQSSATATYLQSSSATATYVQISSLTATYLQASSATATYFQKALILPVANGGNGTASPTMNPGTNMTSITGSWPNLTFNAATQASGGGSGNIVGLSSQGSVPYYSVAGSSNTFSNFPNVSFSTTTGIVFSSSVVMGVGGYSVLMASNVIMTGTTFYQNGTIVSGSILTQSSATATYIQVSSLTATYLSQSSATATYFQSALILPVANGGTGTASPGLIAGTNITSITGSWPNQTINASGGGATASSQLTDLTVVRTDSTHLVFAQNCTVATPCYPKHGDHTYTYNSGPSTATISAGSLTAYIYMDPSSGALTVGTNGGTVSCAGCTWNAAISTFPLTALQIYTWTSTSGAWDSSGGTRYLSYYSTPKTMIAGGGIGVTETPDTVTITSYGGGSSSGSIVAAPQYSAAYYSASGTTNTVSGVPPGTLGQVLTSSGTSGSPFWSTISSSGGSGGGGVGGAFSSWYMVDSGAGKWYVQDDTGGHLVSTSTNTIPTGSLAVHNLVTQDASFNLWTITIDTGGHLVTTLAGSTAQSITDLLMNDSTNITWVNTVDTGGHMATQ